MAFDDDGYLGFGHAVFGPGNAIFRAGQTTRSRHRHRYEALTATLFHDLLLQTSGSCLLITLARFSR